MGDMILTPTHKILIGIGAVALIAGGLYLARDLWSPVPDHTTYHDRSFSFSYPRTYEAEEYAPGTVFVGDTEDGTFTPQVEVVQYESDPDVALPATFDAYVKKQALALCGTDGPVESATCTDAALAPYTSAQGLTGQELTLTILRTNLESGTTTTATFAPVYVFNMTRPLEAPEDTFRYEALFVYPSFASVIAGPPASPLLAEVIDSLVLPRGTSTTTSR